MISVQKYKFIQRAATPYSEIKVDDTMDSKPKE